MSDELKRQQAMEGLGRIVKVIEYPYCTCPDSSSFGHEPGCPILTANVAVREAIEAAWQDVREKIISFESFYKAMQPHFTAAVRAAVKERGEDTKRLYHELLFEVENKYDGESRHDTARRLIRQAQRGSDVPQQEASRERA